MNGLIAWILLVSTFLITCFCLTLFLYFFIKIKRRMIEIGNVKKTKIYAFLVFLALLIFLAAFIYFAILVWTKYLY